MDELKLQALHAIFAHIMGCSTQRELTTNEKLLRDQLCITFILEAQVWEQVWRKSLNEGEFNEGNLETPGETPSSDADDEEDGTCNLPAPV